jgi:hypothetical protein
MVRLALLLLLVLAPSASAAGLLSADLRADGASSASCLQPRGGAGVVRRPLVADANGLVRARLQSGAGDWDVAVFDVAGELVAGSAHFGASELAEGFVEAGEALTLQACRRSGAGPLAQVSVQNILLPPAGPGRTQLVRVHLTNDVEMELLQALDLDLTEHGRDGYLDVLLHGDEDLARLTGSGLRFEVPTPTQRRLGPPDGTMPSGRLDYRRLADFGEDMKKLAADNPTLVKPITLPNRSLEGRPVEGVEITENVQAADGKPVFLNMGVHHAREWPSGELAMEWAFELVNTFKAGDERTVGLLKKARVIVIPIVNPDGYNLSRESPVDGGSAQTDVGFAYKRKNCRITAGELPREGECGLDENRSAGVDPNRNYGGFWGGPGASKSEDSDTYRGAGPFSEPETENIHWLMSTRQVATMITNHTYADLVLRPPGVASAPPPPDEALLKELGDSMAAENGYTSQHGFDLYATTGSAEDWSYYATGGLGYTFEIGRYDNIGGGSAVTGAGFHPPYPSVVLEWFGKQPTGGGNRAAYYLALESTADEKRHAVITGRGAPGAVIRMRKTFTSQTLAGPTFKEDLNSVMQVPASGSFEFHVNQSTRPLVAPTTTEAWTLSCEAADGSVLGRQDVVIARGERKDVGSACAGAVAPPAPPVDTKLTLGVAPRRTTLRTLLRKGLSVKVTCSIHCDVSAQLLKRSRKLTRRGVTTATLRLRLTKPAARKLRRARRATLKLRVSAPGAQTVTRTLRLKR